jgi:predicted flap endonuclease-1-like 5' DNA nuclease
MAAEEAPELTAEPVPAPELAVAEPPPEPEPMAEAPAAPVEAAPEPAPAAGPDDLTRMKGVGPRLAERLNTVGVTSFAQIAALTPEAAAELDSKLGDFQGRLERDRWIDQAGYLASGDIAGFEENFGKL